MRHSLLHHHVQKEILSERNNAYTEQILKFKDVNVFKKKPAKLKSSNNGKIAQNFFLLPATLQISEKR